MSATLCLILIVIVQFGYSIFLCNGIDKLATRISKLEEAIADLKEFEA